jgi:hypothetical protein
MKRITICSESCEVSILIKEEEKTWVEIYSMFVDAIRGLGYEPTQLENLREQL